MSVGCASVPNKAEIKQSIKNQLELLDKIPDVPSVLNPLSGSPPQPASGIQKAEEPRKLRAEIWTESKEDKPCLIIHFENGLPYPCLFKYGDYACLVLSFPTEISKKKFSDAVVPELRDLEIIYYDDATVVRWKMDSVYPRLKIELKENQFHLDLSKHVPSEDGFDLEVFQPRRKGDAFQGSLKNAQSDITLDLECNGHNYWIIFADQKNRMLPRREYPEFTLLESYQGLAIDLKSEDLDYSYARKSFHISKHGGIGNSLALMGGSPFHQKTIFDDFILQNPSEKIRELILKVYSGSPNLEDAVDLVWAYLIQGMAQEAQGVMTEIQVKNQDLALTNLWKAFAGLAALLRGQYEKARTSLVSIYNEPDIDFWRSIAECCDNKTVGEDHVASLIRGKKHLFKLPPAVRDKLWVQILETALLNGHQKILEEFTLKGEVPTTRIARPIYNLVSAYLKLDPNNPSTVNELFDIWQNSLGTKVSVLAAFERLKFLRKVKKIEPEQELKQLEQLRFQWRGDLLEYTLDKYLIDRYMEEKQYAKLLPVARKTIKYFVKESHEDGLPKLMQDALIKYFEQDHPPVLEMLSIFQEYTSIAPDTKHGDMIMIRATNVLANLELYDVVVNLLREYLSHKTKDGDDRQERQNKILYRMSVAYHLARKFPDALKTLEEIKEPSQSIADDVAILKAEAYLQSGSEEKALYALGDTAAQLTHKADILIGSRKWSQAVEVYTKLLFKDYKISDSEKARAIVNYVLCLYMEKNTEKIREAGLNFAEFMKDKTGNQAFELMTIPTAKVNLTQLHSIQQVTSFTERLKQLFSD